MFLVAHFPSVGSVKVKAVNVSKPLGGKVLEKVMLEEYLNA